VLLAVRDTGTGMGLAVVHGVVSRCRGCISVETEVGRGTSVHVYFPLQAEAPGLAGPPRPLENGYRPDVRVPAFPRLRVLYVDDEFQIARLAQRHLARYGMDVHAESDSAQAMALLRERIAGYDVLVTDQTMPSVTGLELAMAALRLDPDFPVVLCTGYSELVSRETAQAAGIRGYLEKPLDYGELAYVIRACVAHRSERPDSAIPEDAPPPDPGAAARELAVPAV
jgi:CheY-like chemotaxis protein